MGTTDDEAGGLNEDEPPPEIHTQMERAQRRLLRRAKAGAAGPLDKAALKRLASSPDLLEGDLEKLEDLDDLADIERAQEVAYLAMEADNENEAILLCREALDFDPRNVDALRLQIELEATNPAELIGGLTRAVEAGEAALGEAFFEENRGSFYGFLEARPYMRVRAALAETLLADGQLDPAREHYAGLLELNPNDNQANRFPLLALLLRQGDTAAARAVSDMFDEDYATMEWGRVLLCWLEDDKDAAGAALCTAARRNAFVAARLQGPAPEGEEGEEQASTYSPGTYSEVPVVLETMRPAFDVHAGFMPWLREALADWDFRRASEWVERKEEERGESAPEWAVGFFSIAARERGHVETRTGKGPSATEAAWHRLMAGAAELRGEDTPGYGFVPCAAVNILGQTPDAETAQLLVDQHVEFERDDDDLSLFSDFVDAACKDMGPLIVEPALAALEAGHSGPDGFSWLLATLANAGVRNQRILTLLLKALPANPDPIATFTEEYGDPAALPLLGLTLDLVLARTPDDPLLEAHHVAALRDAIEALGGAFTPAQEQALLVLSDAHSGFALAAGPSVRTPDKPTYPTTAQLHEPLRARGRPGRNEACWCGSGKKYKRCHLLEDESTSTL